MEALKLEDFLHYRFLSALRYAPDGRKAAFAVSQADEEKNTYQSCLYLYDGQFRQLTSLGREKGFSFLDENRLIFPAVRTEREKEEAESGLQRTHYYCLDLRGGEALPFMTLPFPAERLEVLDENHFAVLGSFRKEDPDLWEKSEEEQKKAAEAARKEKDYEVFDESPFWFNGQGVINGHRTALFLVDLNPFRIRRITGAGESVDELCLLNGQVIFSTMVCKPQTGIRGCHIRSLNPETGEVRPLYDSDTLMLHHLLPWNGRIGVFASEGSRYGLNENGWVYTLSPQGGDLTLVRKEEMALGSSVGSDCRLGGSESAMALGENIYAIQTIGGDSTIVCLTPDGESRRVMQVPGSCDGLAVNENAREILYVGMQDMQLQELYALDPVTGETRQLSHFNTDFFRDRHVARPVPLTTEGGVNGWVLLPKDYDEEKTYPAVLDIHGGPKTVYGPVFYHEMQLWAGMGYFVFFCNPRGSDGGDNDFMDIRGKYGTIDYDDLMAFTDAVLEAYPRIDRSKVCVTGGSYGGFMTNWIIGHTDRFCCAASQRSISNWLSFWGVSDIGPWFVEDQNHGNLYTSPEKLWEHSPLRYAANAHTPTLFIHSDEDYRCPLEQGLQMYTALLDHEVETRLCLFHGENHELSRSGKPQHRMRRLREITDWFEKHTGRNAKEA